MKLHKDTDPILLPAGRVEEDEDLDRQLGIEEDRSALWMIVACGLFVIGLMLAIVAGLSYAHWKHLIF
jgi:uncharacterized protein (DUF983 family)